MGPGYGAFNGGCFGLGGGFGMMFLGILIVGLIIYLLFKGINNNQNDTITSSNKGSTNANALEIAKTRLAKGEITAEEYENIKKTLM